MDDQDQPNRRRRLDSLRIPIWVGIGTLVIWSGYSARAVFRRDFDLEKVKETVAEQRDINREQERVNRENRDRLIRIETKLDQIIKSTP